MTIEFRCTSCNKLLRVKDESAGKKAKCPGCSNVLQIPAPQAEPQQPEESPFDFASPPAAAASSAPAFGAPAQEENPYLSPSASSQAYTPGSAARSGAVTAVAIVNYILGGLQLVCGMFVIFGGAMLASMIGAGAAQDPELDGVAAAGALGGLVLIMGIFVMLLGVPMLLAGYGVQQRRQWGRILTFVMGGLSGLGAIINLVSLSPAFILNAAYAIMVFVILLNKKYAAEFS